MKTYANKTDSVQQSSSAAANHVSQRKNKTGIPDRVLTKMETVFNRDFSHVKVHANSTQAEDAGASALAQGTDVHFAPGQYNPGTASGNKLLGHELAHVVQQAEGRVQPTGTVAGMPLNDSPALEKEADRMGAKVG